jgi:hypothetical protein
MFHKQSLISSIKGRKMKGRGRKKSSYCNRRIPRVNLILNSNNNSINKRSLSIRDLQMKLLIFLMNRRWKNQNSNPFSNKKRTYN